MTKNKIIVKQLLKIERLKSVNKQNINTADLIHKKFICIGGPLNENKLQFNAEQLRFLKEIDDQIQNIIERRQ